MKNKWIHRNILREENFYLQDSDFYPPSDDRTFQTYMEELYDGEFAKYAEYIFDLYESEDYWEN